MTRFRVYAIMAVVMFIMAAVVMAEGSLFVAPSLRFPPDQHTASAMAISNAATLQEVQTKSRDGIDLRAWLLVPQTSNGNAVILLHGVGDTRNGMLGHARYLLNHGYTCLLPDARGHGSSGGDLITFGVRESNDVTRWIDRLTRDVRYNRVFGLGESMGAGILLQTLPGEPRIRAAVAECSFSDFQQIGSERVGQMFGVGAGWPFRPLVSLASLYVRLRYGVALADANPSKALARTTTPVLLIHGQRDTNIGPHHSRALLRARPANTVLWEVPGAVHVGALGADTAAFEKRVLDWFKQTER